MNADTIVIFLIVLYVIYTVITPGYLTFLPSLPVHPNNYKDTQVVKVEISNRTKEDEDMFYLTNESVVNAFLPFVDESEEELTDVSLSQNHIILFFKYLINRRRPYQVDPSIKPLNVSTSQTPSYPAGHAYQALVVSKYLSRKYPGKKSLFESIAKNCDLCRVRAGLHYTSDGEFSRQLFNLFN